jgi:hypothetical protein
MAVTPPSGPPAAAGHAPARELEDRQDRIGRRPPVQTDPFHLRPEDAQISAGVDGALRGAPPAQALDGAVHRVAFGDPAEIDPDRPAEANRSAREQLDIAPAPPGIGTTRTIGRREEAPVHQLRCDCDVEPPPRVLAHLPRQSQDLRRARIHRHGSMERLPVEATDVAVGLVEAHARVNVLDLREGGVDGSVSPAFGQPADPDGDEGAQERPRPLNDWQARARSHRSRAVA